jgi:hypothetical protein
MAARLSMLISNENEKAGDTMIEANGRKAASASFTAGPSEKSPWVLEIMAALLLLLNTFLTGAEHSEPKPQSSELLGRMSAPVLISLVVLGVAAAFKGARTRRSRAKIFLITMAVILASHCPRLARSVERQSRLRKHAATVHVQWPAGWTVSRTAAPPICGAPGETLLAMRHDPQAAMQLAIWHRCDQGRVELDVELASAVAYVRKTYEAQGRIVEVSGARQAVLGRLRALEADVLVSDADGDLKSTMMFSAGRDDLYHFVFTVRQADQDRFTNELRATLASLKLD